MHEDSFNWNDSEVVVFPTSSGVALYTNVRGEMVIRQEGHLGEDDTIIAVSRKELENSFPLWSAGLKRNKKASPPEYVGY